MGGSDDWAESDSSSGSGRTALLSGGVGEKCREEVRVRRELTMSTNPHAPVVVGIDGSDEAACAADYAAWEADRRGVELHLIYAHHPAPLWGPSNLILDDYAWERDWVRSLLEKSLQDVRDAHPDVTASAAAKTGGPAGVLVDESAEAGLVVVGTRSFGGLLGHLAGSVAAQVAAHAACPVVVIRGLEGRRCDMSMFAGKPVVVGVDGSEPAQLAIKFAVEQAVAREVDLHAVLAWSVIDVHFVGDIVPETFDLGEEAAKADRLLDETLTGWADRYPDLQIHRHAVHELDPVKALLDESERASLVVVGSRGVGGFTGLLLGSTVDGLVRHSAVPVAVVHGDVDDN
jgi:nucleotide-binding universal stress UspA family protein